MIDRCSSSTHDLPLKSVAKSDEASEIRIFGYERRGALGSITAVLLE